MKKVIVIDSAKREVYEAHTSDYKDIYTLLGEDVHTFACPVQFNESDGLFVDDEGLYNRFEGGYMFPDWSYLICGNGVICGSDEEGESADVQMSVEDVLANIKWVSKAACIQWQQRALGGAGFAFYSI